MKRLFKWLGLAAVALVLLVAFAGWLADAWLESNGGRRLLEAELSGAIGYPVRLGGDYRFRLVPRISIEGQSLSIGQPPADPGASPPITIERFRAVIGLLPLLREQLRIDAVELEGGQLFLRQLEAPGAASQEAFPEDQGAQEGPDGSGLPAVGSIRLRRIVLHLAADGTALRIDELSIEGFRPGRPVGIRADAALLTGDAEIGTARLDGSLRVAPDGRRAGLDLDPLTVRRPGAEPEAITGTLEWSAEAVALHSTEPARPAAVNDSAGGGLTGELSYSAPTGSMDLDVDVRLGATVAGLVRARYQPSEQPGTAELEASFHGVDGGYVFDALALQVADQTVSGTGCVNTTDTPSVELHLVAGRLDLDRLASWVPDGEGGADGDLPLDLAAVVEIERANLSGATAEGVRLVVGREPQCPPAEEPSRGVITAAETVPGG